MLFCERSRSLQAKSSILVTGFPENPDEPYTVSEMGLGGYLEDGGALYVRLRVAPLNENFHRSGAAYVVVVATNLALDPETGEPTREEATSLFGNIYRAFNSAFVLFENGRLVSSAVFADGEKVETQLSEADQNPFIAVNLVDTLIRDGDEANDVYIQPIFDRIGGLSDLPVPVRATADLNTLMYEVFQGRLDDADRTLETLLTEYTSIREQSFRSAIEVQAPALIELARNATANTP